MSRMIAGGAVIRPENGMPTKLVGIAGCEVFIDGEARREYQRQWRKLYAERERARTIELDRNRKNGRLLAELKCADSTVGPIRRAARRAVDAYAVGYAVARELAGRMLRLLIRGGLVEVIE